jgi:hypothetical protein
LRLTKLTTTTSFDSIFQISIVFGAKPAFNKQVLQAAELFESRRVVTVRLFFLDSM